MPHVRDYHRPASIESAIALLNRGDVATKVLAGGTVVNADPEAEPIDLVDIQALGLREISLDGTRLRIDAGVTLQQLAEDVRVPHTLRVLARREMPSTLRSLATVGGTAATAHPTSELLAALLVHHAQVRLTLGSGTSVDVDLESILGAFPLGSLITSVAIDTSGTTVTHRTGRTPADDPIVAVVGRRTVANNVEVLEFAMTGVAPHPLCVDESDIDSLTPPDDFRGTASYRRELARVLLRRATEELCAPTAPTPSSSQGVSASPTPQPGIGN